jgi:hypothetical protein
MPFERSVAHAFTASSIRNHAPFGPGVYGISNSREWIYIGETDNIQNRLFEHLQESGTFLKGRSPTGFVYEICGSDIRTKRRDRLIREYGPAGNGHHI